MALIFMGSFKKEVASFLSESKLLKPFTTKQFSLYPTHLSNQTKDEFLNLRVSVGADLSKNRPKGKRDASKDSPKSPLKKGKSPNQRPQSSKSAVSENKNPFKATEEEKEASKQSTLTPKDEESLRWAVKQGYGNQSLHGIFNRNDWSEDQKLEALQYLLEQGQQNRKALDIENTDSEGKTILHTAASQGLKDIFHFLLHQGANIKAKDLKEMTPLAYLLHFGPIDILKENINNLEESLSNGLKLHIAIMDDDMNSMARLINTDDDSDMWGGITALHSACRYGSEEMIIAVSKICLDNSKFEKYINARSHLGETPLDMAIQGENANISCLLEESYVKNDLLLDTLTSAIQRTIKVDKENLRDHVLPSLLLLRAEKYAECTSLILNQIKMRSTSFGEVDNFSEKNLPFSTTKRNADTVRAPLSDHNPASENIKSVFEYTLYHLNDLLFQKFLLNRDWVKDLNRHNLSRDVFLNFIKNNASDSLQFLLKYYEIEVESFVQKELWQYALKKRDDGLIGSLIHYSRKQKPIIDDSEFDSSEGDTDLSLKPKNVHENLRTEIRKYVSAFQKLKLLKVLDQVDSLYPEALVGILSKIKTIEDERSQQWEPYQTQFLIHCRETEKRRQKIIEDHRIKDSVPPSKSD